MARGILSGERKAALRGGVGLWSFVAHRATGVVLALFLALVALDFAFVFAGAGSYDGFRDVYDGALFHLFEVAVAGALLFHALNGVRVVAIDLSAAAAREHRRLFNVQVGVFFALFVPAAWVLVARAAL